MIECRWCHVAKPPTGFTEGRTTCKRCRDDAYPRAEREKQQNDRSRQVAARHGQTWTTRELAVALSPLLTQGEAAARLGRTVRSIKNARNRYRT